MIYTYYDYQYHDPIRECNRARGPELAPDSSYASPGARSARDAGRPPGGLCRAWPWPARPRRRPGSAGATTNKTQEAP